jgi:hypothetical protein
VTSSELRRGEGVQLEVASRWERRCTTKGQRRLRTVSELWLRSEAPARTRGRGWSRRHGSRRRERGATLSPATGVGLQRKVGAATAPAVRTDCDAEAELGGGPGKKIGGVQQAAVAVLEAGHSDACDHWRSYSRAAGDPAPPLESISLCGRANAAAAAAQARFCGSASG